MVYTSTENQIGEVYDGTYFQKLSATGFLLKQDNSVFTDTSRVHSNPTSTITRNYNVSVKTAFIAPSGLLSYDRVYRVMALGEYVGAHSVQMKFRMDYNESYILSSAVKVLSSAPAGGYEPADGAVNHPLYLFRAHLLQQKCRSLQVEILLTSSTTAAAHLDGIAFEVGVRPKKSAFKTIADRTL